MIVTAMAADIVRTRAGPHCNGIDAVAGAARFMRRFVIWQRKTRKTTKPKKPFQRGLRLLRTGPTSLLRRRPRRRLQHARPASRRPRFRRVLRTPTARPLTAAVTAAPPLIP